VQEAQQRMQGVVGVVVDPDLQYWNSTMEIMAKDCVGVPVAARDHLKTEVQACISRFKEGVEAGVRLPSADLQYHTQKRFMVAQAPPPVPAPAPAPPAQPVTMQGPVTLTGQQVAQLQAGLLQGLPFGPRPLGSSTPTPSLDCSLGDSFWNLLQQPGTAQPTTTHSPAPAETASSSTTQNNPARPT